MFLAKNKQKFGEIDLVIIGKKGWLYESILEAPNKFGVESSVKFLDFVPDDELSIFYSSALCFALPSLYEGFGFQRVGLRKGYYTLPDEDAYVMAMIVKREVI